MKLWTQIGLLFIVAVLIEVIVATFPPHHLLPAQYSVYFGESGMMASVFLIPAFVVFAPLRFAVPLSLGRRLLFAVLISLFAIVEFHGVFVLPAAAELARQRGDSLDGEIILSLGLIMVGWFPPFVMTVIFCSIRG
jgi:hypothetical protein